MTKYHLLDFLAQRRKPLVKYWFSFIDSENNVINDNSDNLDCSRWQCNICDEKFRTYDNKIEEHCNFHLSQSGLMTYI